MSNAYMQNTDQMKTLKSTDKKFVKAVEAMRRNIAAIQADEDLTYFARQRKIIEEQQTTQERIDRITQEYQQAAHYMRDYLASLIADPKPSDTNAALLNELEEQRAWNRYSPMLSSRPPIAVIEAAAQDPIGLRTLKKELPAFILTTNPHLNGAELVRRTEHLNDEINRHYEPFLSERQKAAKAVADEVDRGVRHLSISAQFAHKEASGGDRATLLSWDGQLLDVDE